MVSGQGLLGYVAIVCRRLLEQWLEGIHLGESQVTSLRTT